MSWASFYVLVHIFICFKFEMSYIFTQILFYSLYEKNIGPYYFNYVFSYTVAIMHIKKKEKTSIKTTDEFLSSPLLYSPQAHHIHARTYTSSITLYPVCHFESSTSLPCFAMLFTPWLSQSEGIMQSTMQ